MRAPLRATIAAFMFHEVTDDPASTGFQRPGARAYKHTTLGFGRCLDEIGAATTTPPALVTEVDLAQPGRHILLTFDDGGRSALAIAAALERRGWRGHFFIVTSLIGTRGFLDDGAIHALRHGGHLIGSHSHTHPNIFRELSPAQMHEEWRTSVDELAQLLGEPCLAASVPGGDISPAVLDSAAQAGLRYLFTSEPWIVPRQVDACWVLGRASVKATMRPEEVGELAHFRGWTGALARRRLKVWASRALPALYRLYVRLRTRAAE